MRWRHSVSRILGRTHGYFNDWFWDRKMFRICFSSAKENDQTLVHHGHHTPRVNWSNRRECPMWVAVYQTFEPVILINVGQLHRRLFCFHSLFDRFDTPAKSKVQHNCELRIRRPSGSPYSTFHSACRVFPRLPFPDHIFVERFGTNTTYPVPY